MSDIEQDPLEGEYISSKTLGICVECGEKGPVVRHHVFGQKSDTYTMIVLCTTCHKRRHDAEASEARRRAALPNQPSPSQKAAAERDRRLYRAAWEELFEDRFPFEEYHD